MKKLLILICPVLFLSCKGQEIKGVNKIDSHQMTKALAKDVQLVDVRTPLEYSQGHIPGALNIDYLSGQFKSKLESLDKNKPVYIYCRSGQRSASAAREMSQLGFQQIYDLQGGIGSWEAKLER